MKRAIEVPSLARRLFRRATGCVTGVAVLAGSWLAAPASVQGADNLAPVTVQMRLLSEAQYKNAIADIFGLDVSGRFAPMRRTDGLLAVGAQGATVTPAALEQFESMARNVARGALSPTNRAYLMPCRPVTPTAADEACARQFLGKTGQLLFRRAMTERELTEAVTIASLGATTLGGFYQGLEVALASLLVSPEFVFIRETAEAGPDGRMRLTAASKAARLSFFLWNTTPDAELLAAAARGELETKSGLERQVSRLLASPRFEDGFRAFFSDMLAFDSFEALSKDPIIYPAFSPAVAKDAQEQTLLTAIQVLLRDQEDYRTLFTTRKTYLSGPLGVVYQLPVAQWDTWTLHELPVGDPRAGLLSQISFTALHSHPGRSSATLRGKALRELLMCQEVPRPPPNVDFSLLENGDNAKLKTARARLDVHREDPVCAGCHKVTDPIGLALENFDGSGQFRLTENGAGIDASGDLEGVPFKDVAGLGRAVAANPAVTSCLAQRAYSYAVSRPLVAADEAIIERLTAQFAQDKFRIPAFWRSIATSDAFFAVPTVTPAAPPIVTSTPASSKASTGHGLKSQS